MARQRGYFDSISIYATTPFGVLYDVEHQAQQLDADQRWQWRQQLARPAAETLHA